MENNQPLPDLTGTVTDGSQLSLASLKGSWVIVYFYPRDNTPGCTNEAKDFRDRIDVFNEYDAKIIGVSRDSVTSHQRFTEKHHLPFPLVADTDETWCKTFDVIGEKKLYGKVHLGIIRSTFLFSPDGHLHTAWRKVRVPGHVDTVLNTLHSPTSSPRT